MSNNDDNNNKFHETPPRSPSQPLQAGLRNRKRVYFGSDNRKTNSHSGSRSSTKANLVHPLRSSPQSALPEDKGKRNLNDHSATVATSTESEKRRSSRLAEAKHKTKEKGIDDKINSTDKGGQLKSTDSFDERASVPKTPARHNHVPPRPLSRHRQPIPLISPPSPTRAPTTVKATNITALAGAPSHSSAPLSLGGLGTTALDTLAKDHLKFGFLHEQSYLPESTGRSFYTEQASRTIAQIRAGLLQTPALDRHGRRTDPLHFSSPTPPPTSLITPGLYTARPSTTKSKRTGNEDVFGTLSPSPEIEDDNAAEGRDPLFDTSNMPPLRELPPRYSPELLPADPAEYFCRFRQQKREKCPISRSKTRRSDSKRRHDPDCPISDTEDDQDKEETQRDKSRALSDEPPPLTHEPSPQEQQPPTEMDQPTMDVADLPIQTDKAPVPPEAGGAQFKYRETGITWPDPFAYLPIANPLAAAPVDYRRRQVQSSPGPILVDESDQEDLLPGKLPDQAGDGVECAQTDAERPRLPKQSRSSRTKKKTYARGRTHAYKAGMPDPVHSSQRRSLSPDVFGSYTGAKRKVSTTLWRNDDQPDDPLQHEFLRNGPWPEQRDQPLFDPASPPPINRGPMMRNGKRYGPITEAFIYVSDAELDQDVEPPRKKRKHKKRPHSHYTEVAKLRMARDRSAERRMHKYMKKRSQHRSTGPPLRRPRKDVSRIPGYNLKAIPTISMDVYKQLYQNKHPSSSNPTPQEIIGDPRVPELIKAARRATLEAHIRGQKRYTRQVSPAFPVRPLRPTQDDPQHNDRIERFGSQQAQPRLLENGPHTCPLPKLRLVNGNSESPTSGKRRRDQDDSTTASDTTGRESGPQNIDLERFFNFPSRRSMQKKTNLDDLLNRPLSTHAHPPKADFDLNLVSVNLSPEDLSSSSFSGGRKGVEKIGDDVAAALNGEGQIDIPVLQSLAELSKHPLIPPAQGSAHQSIPLEEPQPVAAHDPVTKSILARDDISAAAKRQDQHPPPTTPPLHSRKIQSPDLDITNSQAQRLLEEEEANRERNRQVRLSGSTASITQLNEGVTTVASHSVISQNAGKEKPSSDPNVSHDGSISQIIPKVAPSSDPPNRASKSISKRPSRSGLELTDHLLAQASNLKHVAMLETVSNKDKGQSSTRPSASTPTGKRVQRVEDRRERVSAKHRASAEKTFKQTTLEFGKTVGGSGTSGLAQKTVVAKTETGVKTDTAVNQNLDLGKNSIANPAASMTSKTTPRATSIDRRPLSSITPARIGISSGRTSSNTSQSGSQFTPTQLQERYQRSSQTAITMSYKNPTRSDSQATRIAQEVEKSHSKENVTLRSPYDKEVNSPSSSKQHHSSGSDTSKMKTPTPIPRGKFPSISPMINPSSSSLKQDQPKSSAATTPRSADGERRRQPHDEVEIGEESSKAQGPTWKTAN